MVNGRVPLRRLYKDDEIIGKMVRITSKSSKHYGMFGRIVGVCEGELSALKVYVSDTKCKFNICRGSVELIN